MYLAVKNPALDSSIGNASAGNFRGAGPALSSIVTTVVELIFGAGIIAFVLMLLFGGYQWITSGGDKDSLAKARNRINHALVGLIILFSVYAFLALLSDVLGLDLVRFTLHGIQ